MGPDRPSVLLAEQYALARDLLKGLIAAAGDLELVGEAADHRALLDCLRRREVRVLLLGTGLHDREVLDVVRDARREAPQIAVCLVVSQDEPSSFAMCALRAGALGIVTRTSPAQAVVDAIRTVARGERYLDAAAKSDLMLSVLGEGVDRGRDLSQRELQVFQMLTSGKPTREIAALLKVSPKTVSTHRARLYQKLQVNSVVELVRYAFKQQMTRRADDDAMA